jgi:ATP-dependent Lhr-like helicase
MTSSPPSSSSPRGAAILERLHSGVQRWVWDQGWSELRPVQEKAAAPILAGDRDVIISAPTAGGKTEAAFLPIASRLAEDQPAGVGCLCVSPLKALITDQCDRLTPLFERVGLPLTPWHGDVAESLKGRFRRDPRGALLITPESLEAMFVRRGPTLPDLFGSLSYVVVDELHSFIGSARGRQLQSLLHRIELAVRRRIPRIALSATLGDMQLAAEALRPGEADEVVLINGNEDGWKLKVQLRGYRVKPPAPQKDGGQGDQPEELEGDSARMVDDLYAALHGESNLVFANSRRSVEECTDKLRRKSEDERVPNEFFAHHGNLSKEIREDAEQRLKSGRPTSVICTSTLELGIDIGDVTAVAQMGPPPSVAAMRQRLGRSGRRENSAAILRFYVDELAATADPRIEDELRVELFQSVAMVQLMIENWCEPPPPSQLHFSTLIQQLLSMIAQHGGVSARDAYRALCASGPFRSVRPAQFATLLRSLGAEHLITQMGNDELVIGEQGDRIVGHYSFYAAFPTVEEYRLVAGPKTLGTLPVARPLSVGGYLIFAGRRWQIVRIEDQTRVVELTPANGGRAPKFDGGGPEVHDRIRAEMRCLYESSFVPVYLDRTAKELLDEGRDAYRRHGLNLTQVLRADHRAALFPWRGNRVMDTLLLQLDALSLDVFRSSIAIIVKNADDSILIDVLERIAEGDAPSGEALAARAGNKHEEKYDRYLEAGLLCADYASRHFDAVETQKCAGELLESVRKNR